MHDDVPPATAPEAHDRRGRTAMASLALFLCFFSLYALTGPGRIDIIDGQYRWEVARVFLAEGKPAIEDPALTRSFHVSAQPDGRYYANYGAGHSFLALPLVALAGLFHDPKLELSRFLFSMTHAATGAGVCVLLLLFYRRLGMSLRRGVLWASVFGVASYHWPMATSTFEQGSHELLLLAAALAAYAGRRQERLGMVAMGGAVAGLLFCFQLNYALLLLPLSLILVRDGDRRGSLWRMGVFLASSAGGLVLWMLYNLWRFDSPFFLPTERPGLPPLWGEPVIGMMSLLFSPGKSIVLYSPFVLVSIIGIPALFRRARWLTVAVLATAFVQYLLISSLTFFGSDWAWGPRYLLVLLPLLALAAPFALPPGCLRRRRVAVGMIVAVSVAVQIMGLAVDHQRFFFERNLPAFFWYQRPWHYFEISAVLARPAEILDIATNDPPPEAKRFVPAPHRDVLTYCIFGTLPSQSRTWMRGFQVFYVWRPWVAWMYGLPPDQRPIAPTPFAAFFALLGLSGGALLRASLRARVP